VFVPGTLFPQPQAPDLNEGLTAGTIADTPKQPLAFNPNLIGLARQYGTDLLAANQFTHTLNGTTLSHRANDAGFTGWFTLGENLAVTDSSGTHIVNEAQSLAHHVNLFVDNNVIGRGHRTSMMNGSFREIGIGMADSTTHTLFPCCSNAALSTQDFGAIASDVFLTGVVYNDLDFDDFYSPDGEGLGPAVVAATPLGGGSALTTSTYASGGYALKLPDGDYSVTVTGFFGAQPLGTVTISGQNVKLDAINPIPEPAGLLFLIAAVRVVVRRRRSAVR